MAKRIGLVQTRGIGDIIIALPIADHFIEQGCEVFWPIDEHFLEMFRAVKPEVNFVDVKRPEPLDYNYFLNDPVKLLRQHDCDRIVILYSRLSDINVTDQRLAMSLKFDEYKYAVAGVPFEKKWRLKYERNFGREENLFQKLNIEGDYAVIHDQGSAMTEPIEVSPNLIKGLQTVRICPITDNVFDWRLTIERAAQLIMVDSCFANMVEQLNLENEKAFFPQWPVHNTPVFVNKWRFVFPERKLQ